MTGEISHSLSIDKSAPIELPTSVTQLNYANPSNQFHKPIRVSGQSGPIAIPERDEDGQAPSKIARFDEIENMRIKNLTAKLDAEKVKKSGLTASAISGDKSKAGGDVASLRDALGTDQIAALKVC